MHTNFIIEELSSGEPQVALCCSEVALCCSEVALCCSEVADIEDLKVTR